MSARVTWQPAPPTHRIAFVGRRDEVELLPPEGAARGWRWSLNGPGKAMGTVQLDLDAMIAFGDGLDAMIAGRRNSAQLTSGCGRLWLGVVLARGGPWLYFRLGQSNGSYSIGEMRVTTSSLETTAAALGVTRSPCAEPTRDAGCCATGAP
jgi:hypothetical protein